MRDKLAVLRKHWCARGQLVESVRCAEYPILEPLRHRGHANQRAPLLPVESNRLNFGHTDLFESHAATSHSFVQAGAPDNRRTVWDSNIIGLRALRDLQREQCSS